MSSSDRAAELAVVAGRPFFSSWSGGKDSYLALQRAVAGGGRPVALLTMTDEDGRRTHSHALPVSLVARQAQALGLPLVVRSASWDTYEAAFIDGWPSCAASGASRSACSATSTSSRTATGSSASARSPALRACLPLWGEPRRALLDELLAAGIVATVVAVNGDRLDERFLGAGSTRR